MVKYPEIGVRLIGTDGNAFAVMGAVSTALKKAGVPNEEISKFRMECMSGDYDNLLQTCMKWVDVN